MIACWVRRFWLLCQIAAGHGEQSLADPGEDAAVGAGAVLFQPDSWPLRVSKMASIHWRIRNSLRSAGVEAGSGLLRRAGRTSMYADCSAPQLLELAAGEALVSL